MNQDENFFLSLSDEEQVKELATIIASKKDETFIEEVMALHRENKIVDVCKKFSSETSILLSLSPKELEPAFNLLIYILKKVDQATLTSLIKSISNDIVTTEISQRPQYFLTILSNLYNNIDPKNSSRYDVFLAMMKLSAKHGKFSILFSHLPNLDNWMTQWGIDNSKKREMFLFISESLKATHQIESYKYTVKYLQTFNASTEESEIEPAKKKARECIVSAFNTPNLFQIDELPKLKVIQSLNPELIYQLLQIFLTQGYREYIEISKEKQKEIADLGLSHENNCTKFRLITLATLATETRELSYTHISEALSIPETEVEKWVIQAIQSQLIDAKIDQLKRIVVVSRTTYRVFEKPQWISLRDGLQSWRNNIGEILKVIQNAKLANQGVLKA